MSPVVLLSVALVCLSLGVLVWAVLDGPDAATQRVRVNLNRGGPAVLAGEESGPVTRSRLAGIFVWLLPSWAPGRLERMLARAGRPAAWPMERLVAVKVVGPALTAALGYLYWTVAPGALTVLLSVAAVVVVYFLPELLLHSRAQERSTQIGLELADTLDQMTIAVEAGLGFDQAMQRAAANGRGPLAEELTRTLQDISAGRPRRDAYTSLAARTGAPDLRRFMRAIIQADKYGVAIADTLRTQASEMRMKRRQRAEEKAMQIPVKVIFPLMLCILPVLFIVLMGPAALDIIAAFSEQ
ncbi:MAG: type II secretion system F family protein [Ornithinimicrobium sp.]|uniref:type II secretion system F family protein n=1 Tax=Ornithinimicrobium sp. TaxID=1977084 RepID=UPI003D9ABBCB